MVMIKKLVIFYLLIILTCPFFVSMALAEEEGPRAVIFMYHRFGESLHPSTNVTLAQFDEQLDFFESNDLRTRTLEIAILPKAERLINDLEVLQEIDKLQTYLDSLPYIFSTYSFASL